MLAVWATIAILFGLVQTTEDEWRSKPKASAAKAAHSDPVVDDWGDPLPLAKKPTKSSKKSADPPSQAAEMEVEDPPAPALWRSLDTPRKSTGKGAKLKRLSGTDEDLISSGGVVRADAVQTTETWQEPTLSGASLRTPDVESLGHLLLPKLPHQQTPTPARATKVEPAPLVEIPVQDPVGSESRSVKKSVSQTAKPSSVGDYTTKSSSPMSASPGGEKPATVDAKDSPQSPQADTSRFSPPPAATPLPNSMTQHGHLLHGQADYAGVAELVHDDLSAPWAGDGCWFGDRPSNWSFQTRSFAVWRRQPSGRLAVDAVSNAPVASNADLGFSARFAQELVLERRFDAANGMEITGFMTEDSRQGFDFVGGSPAALPFENVSPTGAATNLFSGFTSRASNRIWNLSIDFVQHYRASEESAIKARWFFGPRFVGIQESFELNAGSTFLSSKTDNTLFGANTGLGASLVPVGSRLVLDVSGRYGAYGNLYELSRQLTGVEAAIVDSSRFATTAEFNAEAGWWAADRVKFTAGYRIWNTQGIGRALGQTPADLASASRLVSGNNLFLHGMYVGAAIHWGGATDPNSRYAGLRPYTVRTR